MFKIDSDFQCYSQLLPFLKLHMIKASPVFPLPLSRLESSSYESSLHRAISEAHVLSTAHSPCSPHFRLPRRASASAGANVLYLRMRDAKDTDTWLQVAKCFRIWDLDARGNHRGMWRIIYRGAPLFFVGVPFSDYA